MRFAHNILLLIYLFTYTSLVHAYVGPGAGLSAIGTILAFIAAIVLMIVGFLWYPIKRLIKGKKNDLSQSQLQDDSDPQKADIERSEK